MNIIQRKNVEEIVLPGRMIQKVVGKDAISNSSRISMGFATFSGEFGPMEPHQHAEEICYVLSTEKGLFRKGPAKDQLGEPISLEAGMTLHIPPLEWHVFEFGLGGYIDILFFYGQVDQIRPEEMTSE